MDIWSDGVIRGYLAITAHFARKDGLGCNTEYGIYLDCELFIYLVMYLFIYSSLF